MYLSLLKLDLKRLHTRRLLLNLYLLHQAIYRAFPDAAEGGHGMVLYRADEDKEADAINLLVQSEKEPCWEKAELLSSCLSEPFKIKTWDPQIARGQVLYFRLKANPTVKRNGKRLGLLREVDQLEWLKRKASSSGFTVLSCRVVCEGMEKAERKKGKAEDNGGGEVMSFLAVRFDGILRVDEPQLFLKALKNGIGSGKSMGFGLLSVAPLKE